MATLAYDPDELKKMEIGREELIDRLKITPDNFKGFFGKNITLYAPHPDDESFGSIGTILMAPEVGCNVDVVLMTLQDDDRWDEFLEVSDVAGFRPSRLLDYGGLKSKLDESFLEDGNLDHHNRDLQALLISSIRKLEPDSVFVPCEEEKHLDHREAREAVFYASWRAERPSRIEELGEPHKIKKIAEYQVKGRLYPQEWARHRFFVGDDYESLCFVPFGPDVHELCVRAIQIYDSQLKRDPSYLSEWEEKVRDYGKFIGEDYAEVYRISEL